MIYWAFIIVYVSLIPGIQNIVKDFTMAKEYKERAAHRKRLKVFRRHNCSKTEAKPQGLGCKNYCGLMYYCKIKILLWLSGQTSGNKTCQVENSSAGSPKGASMSTNSQLPSFWIPSLTPEAKPSLLKKPVSNLNIKNFIPRAVGVVIHPSIHCHPSIDFLLSATF